jgi:hypothetical protein
MSEQRALADVRAAADALSRRTPLNVRSATRCFPRNERVPSDLGRIDSVYVGYGG